MSYGRLFFWIFVNQASVNLFVNHWGPIWEEYDGQTYTPRTALLAVVVGVILAVLGIVMALYLILVSY